MGCKKSVLWPESSSQYAFMQLRKPFTALQKPFSNSCYSYLAADDRSQNGSSSIAVWRRSHWSLQFPIQRLSSFGPSYRTFWAPAASRTSFQQAPVSPDRASSAACPAGAAFCTSAVDYLWKLASGNIKLCCFIDGASTIDLKQKSHPVTRRLGHLVPTINHLESFLMSN